MEEKKCCEKCNSDWGGGMIPFIRGCKNLDCPCHTPSVESEECKTCGNDPRLNCTVCGKKNTQDAYGKPRASQTESEERQPSSYTLQNVVSPQTEEVEAWVKTYKTIGNISSIHPEIVDEFILITKNLLSSTEKRVVKEIVHILETSNFVEPNLPRALENIISKIQSKYE